MNDITVEKSDDNLAVWEKVRTVPREFMKTIQGGRLKGKTDISPVWRLRVLTELFGPAGFGWYYEIVDRGVRKTSDEQVSAHVQINLYVKMAGEWSNPIPGLGGSMLMEKEKAGFYHSDECFKMALTDALSVACKALGVAADVYMGMMDTKNSRPQAAPEPAVSDPVQLSVDIGLINSATSMDDLKNFYTVAFKAHKGDPEAVQQLTDAKDKRKRILLVGSVFDGQEVKA
jgi:hypothetical protein